MFVCLFICFYGFACVLINHHGTPMGCFPESFVNIQLDFAEIIRIRKLDWRDGEGKKRRGEGKEIREGENERGGERSFFKKGFLRLWFKNISLCHLCK